MTGVPKGCLGIVELFAIAMYTCTSVVSYVIRALGSSTEYADPVSPLCTMCALDERSPSASAKAPRVTSNPGTSASPAHFFLKPKETGVCTPLAITSIVTVIVTHVMLVARQSSLTNMRRACAWIRRTLRAGPSIFATHAAGLLDITVIGPCIMLGPRVACMRNATTSDRACTTALGLVGW